KATLERDTRRYQFSGSVAPIDLGLRLEDIGGLETEPAATSKVDDEKRREQLKRNGATDAEVEFLLEERVELNAMPSDDLIEMVESKLEACGLEKVVPDDGLLGKTYKEFHRSNELREKFEELEEEFEETKITVPKNLRKRVRQILKEHDDLRWDD